MKNLILFTRRFHGDERGSMAIELVLVVPILVWVLLSTFVYFDVFRVETNSVRATITLAEMFSREDIVDDSFIDISREVLRTLTFEEANPDLRVTVYEYDPDVAPGAFRVVWSEHRGMEQALTDDDLSELQAAGRLPPLSQFNQNIYFETRTQYDAPFNIGIGPFVVTNLEDVTFTSDMVIRPRGVKLCFELDDMTTICDLSAL